MSQNFHRLFFYCALLSLSVASLLFAEDAAIAGTTDDGSEEGRSCIVKKIDVPKADLVVLELKNGMKVCLKKTCSEDEIVVRLTAAGGYSSFPDQKRASVQLAPQIAIHSGIGDYHFDRLHTLLYDHSIEFNSEVQPFCRYVQGTAFMGDVDTLLDLIRLFFIQHRFTENSFKKVMQKEKEKISYRNKRSYKNFDDLFIEFNNPDCSAFKHLTKQAIDGADYQTAKVFFESGFRDPSEFVCVIAGYFDMETMINLVDKHLSAIPTERNHQRQCKIPVFPKFLDGIKTKVVSNQLCFGGESTTVITFPAPFETTNKNFTALENMAILLYVRLKEVLRSQYGVDSMVITVSVEYPFYPCLSSPLIKIQYITGENLVTPMGQTVLSELRKMQKEGVTAEEIVSMNRKYRKAQRIRESENYYWLMVLSNYIMWKWDVESISTDLQPLEDKSQIEKSLHDSFSLDNYTILSAHP